MKETHSFFMRTILKIHSNIKETTSKHIAEQKHPFEQKVPRDQLRLAKHNRTQIHA